MNLSLDDSAEFVGRVLFHFTQCRAPVQASSSPFDGVPNMLTQVLKELSQVSGALDNLTTKLTAMETVGDGMAALLADLSGRIRAADDSEKLNALAADVDAKTAAWTAAVTANTPGATAAEPAPATPTEPTATIPPAETTPEPAPVTTAPAETAPDTQTDATPL